MARDHFRPWQRLMWRTRDRHAPANTPPGQGGGGEASHGVLADLAKLAELQVAHERLLGALQSVRDGVVVCDEHGEIVVRNTGGEAGRPVDLLEEQAIREALSAALGGQDPNRQIELMGPPRRVLEVSARPIRTGRSMVGAVAVVEDVSEHRRTEQIRRDFVSNISHELRTPVGALCVLAETMASETSSAALRRLARRMDHEANRLARMIDDLLTLTVIEAEEIGSETVSVHRFIDEAIDRMTPAAERRNIRVESGEVPDVTVLGDRRQLTSAVFNLLDNAVKYSDEGSEVLVQAAVEFHDGRPIVRIDVIDHGIGIPPRDRERIFERFYRVDKARTRDTGGTGLGLAIVRHAVTNHGGELSVTSREGEGSTFTIMLPVHELPMPTEGNPA
jgi:two-component system, OmpR family, sensor histidine kinase SenX3